MVVNRIETIFNNESGEKEIILDNGKACASIGLSVDSGSVTVSGKVSADSDIQTFGLIDLLTGDITSVASSGAYSVLGAETLYSVTFTAEENTSATAKFVY